MSYEKYKVLCICNTYYQVIFSMQLARTIMSNFDITLMLSNHSRDSQNTVKQIEKLGLFENVVYLETKKIDYCTGILTKFKRLVSVSLSDCFDNDVLHNYYDEMIFYNLSASTIAIHTVLSRYNNKIRISRMEEGILSYDSLENEPLKVEASFTTRYSSIIRKIFNKPDLLDNFYNFYCYYPIIYKGRLHPICVPKISLKDSSLCDYLSEVFEITEDNLSYPEDYIFFTSVYDFEGGESIGEFELVCQIADLVGKENLLIKQHPRDSRSIYTDNGFKVDKNSSVPWEAIQVTKNFSDKVYLTVNSGSVLSGSTMSEKPIKTFYMYKLCNYSGNKSCKKTVADIEEVLNNVEMKTILKDVFIAEKIEDIL